jgi:membrane associated rhomboid family serine protease
MLTRVPPVTTFLVAANVAVFLAQMALPGLVGPFALWPVDAAAATGGQVGFHVWQLVSYGFLHGSLLHLGFNMLALYMFGSALEAVVGSRRYVTYYLVSVIAAGLTQLAVTAVTGDLYPTVGASGGVFGVLLAYAVYFPRNRLFLIFLPIPIPARVFVVIYAAIELFLGVTGTQEGVAHFAHLGGLAGGALMLVYWRALRFARL